jgi:hypothetical protein
MHSTCTVLELKTVLYRSLLKFKTLRQKYIFSTNSLFLLLKLLSTNIKNKNKLLKGPSNHCRVLHQKMFPLNLLLWKLTSSKNVNSNIFSSNSSETAYEFLRIPLGKCRNGLLSNVFFWAPSNNKVAFVILIFFMNKFWNFFKSMKIKQIKIFTFLKGHFWIKPGKLTTITLTKSLNIGNFSMFSKTLQTSLLSTFTICRKFLSLWVLCQAVTLI